MANSTQPKRTYLLAVGRRKSAIARVRYHKKGDGTIEVNGKTLAQYFGTAELRKIVQSPLTLTNHTGDYKITIKVTGGGSHSQAESIRLGIARVLLKVNGDLRTLLKRADYLSRDPREKERKKPGLKRARRAPQWAKR